MNPRHGEILNRASTCDQPKAPREAGAQDQPPYSPTKSCVVPVARLYIAERPSRLHTVGEPCGPDSHSDQNTRAKPDGVYPQLEDKTRAAMSWLEHSRGVDHYAPTPGELSSNPGEAKWRSPCGNPTSVERVNHPAVTRSPSPSPHTKESRAPQHNGP